MLPIGFRNMRFLSIVKGNDYALSLVHFIRHGRLFDRIITLDDEAHKVLTEYNIPHTRETEIFNVYISKVVYTMRYQREVNDIVCYHDVFVNFDDYAGIEKVEANGLLVADREMYWPGVEKSFLPICKVMFADNIPENAEKDYLSKVTTTEDSIYKDFTYSYVNNSYDSWYKNILNGFADDEITLELCKGYDWYDKNNWKFWDIKKFYNKTYINAGHDLQYMNIFADNEKLHIDADLFAKYSVTDMEALAKVSYLVIYEEPENIQKIKLLEK